LTANKDEDCDEWDGSAGMHYMVHSRALGHGQQVYFPSGRRHGGLEFDHKMPGGLHAGCAGPPLPGEVPGKNIEERIPLGRLQSTIIRRIGVAGVQRPNQLFVFLYDNTQKEV
jgi:hypothetical protein